jgi:type IX secretion system PorP/SprF family membrane protein
MLHRLIISAVFLCALAIKAGGQDIHFAQYYNAPLAINPALTGISNGDVRLSSVYRSQWQAANSPFKTVYASAEKKFYRPRHADWWLSAGLSTFYDRAGDGNLASTHVALTGSYTRKLDAENFLTLGLAAGIGQRRFEFGNFNFDNQWDGNAFSPNIPVNEIFDNTSIQYPDLAIGVNWRGQQLRTRTKLDVGAGFFHFNRPNQNFIPGDKSPLPTRLSLYMMPTMQISPTGDIVGHTTAQLQGGYFEALAGLGYRYFLNTRRAREVALQFTTSFRFNAIGDALVPAAEFHYRDLVVGLSWDINVSAFSAATNRNGGPELSLRYIIHRVYPIPAFKACPLI